MRDLDIGSIRRALDHSPRVMIAARSAAVRHRWIEALLGPFDTLQLGESVHVLDIEEGILPPDFERVDLALVILSVTGQPEPSEIATVARLRAQGVPTMLLLDKCGPSASTPVWFPDVPSDQIIRLDDAAEVRRRIASALCRSHPDLLTAMASHFQPLRAEAVDALIREVSWTNSQVALLSNIPAMIPFAGGLVASVADLLILTRNQVGLVFKIAGIHGRDLNDHIGVAVEIAPVIGSAFVWRTLARSLVALLPPPVGAIPKTIVAYTGTFVVGSLAHYYYRHGHRPPPALVHRLRQEGLRLARRALPWTATDP